jgi:hypothetical protein
MRPTLSFVLAATLSMAMLQANAQQPDTVQHPPQPPTAGTPVDIVQDEANLQTLRTRLVGEWEELSPSRNYVDFFADGRVVLHLKKGEIGDLKTLDGTWAIDGDNALTVTFTVKGNRFSDLAQLSFDGDEMLLTKESGGETRHRRRGGVLPEEYRW